MQLPSALSQYRNIERTTTTTTHSFLILLPCVTFSSSRFRCRLALFNAACVDLLHISILSIKPWRHLFLSSVPLHCDSIESIDLRGQTNVEQLIHIADDDAMNQNNLKVRSEGLFTNVVAHISIYVDSASSVLILQMLTENSNIDEYHFSVWFLLLFSKYIYIYFPCYHLAICEFLSLHIW